MTKIASADSQQMGTSDIIFIRSSHNIHMEHIIFLEKCVTMWGLTSVSHWMNAKQKVHIIFCSSFLYIIFISISQVGCLKSACLIWLKEALSMAFELFLFETWTPTWWTFHQVGVPDGNAIANHCESDGYAYTRWQEPQRSSHYLAFKFNSVFCSVLLGALIWCTPPSFWECIHWNLDWKSLQIPRVRDRDNGSCVKYARVDIRLTCHSNTTTVHSTHVIFLKRSLTSHCAMGLRRCWKNDCRCHDFWTLFQVHLYSGQTFDLKICLAVRHLETSGNVCVEEVSTLHLFRK